MSQIGRPSKYQPDFARQAAKACQLGAVDVDLAELFNVSPDTIAEWKNVHPAFSESIKDAKQKLDTQVERSLAQRALGYSHPDTVFHQFRGEVIETPTVKHYPPSEVACIFWLKNRQPKQWRDRQDVTVDISDDMKELARQAAKHVALGDAKTLDV